LPPNWKNFATIGTKRGNALAKLACLRQNALTDFVRTIYADKFSLSAVADTLGEPAMDPLSGRDRPAVPVVIVRLDAEKNVHPNNSRPAECLFPLRDAQRCFLIRGLSKRKFIFTRSAQ